MCRWRCGAPGQDVPGALRQQDPDELAEYPRRAPGQDVPAALRRLAQDGGRGRGSRTRMCRRGCRGRTRMHGRHRGRRLMSWRRSSRGRMGRRSGGGRMGRGRRALLRWRGRRLLARLRFVGIGRRRSLRQSNGRLDCLRARCVRRCREQQQRQRQPELSMIGSCGLSPLESLWSRSGTELTIHDPGAGAQAHRETAEMMTARFHRSENRDAPDRPAGAMPAPEVNWHLDGNSRASRASYASRSTIICLISAMAFAGLRPFGQALVQFMMVWQR